MNLKILIGGILACALTIGAGVYAQDYGSAEMVHFRIGVPAGNNASLDAAGPPGQAVAPVPISIDLSRRGLPKMLLNGDIEGISTHSIVNTGTKPVRIRMEMVNETVPVRWDVSANHPWDPATRTFTEPLQPGKSIASLGMDWYFLIPRDKLYDPVIYNGGLLFTDADTGERITFLPIRIFNGGGSTTAGEACH